MPATAAARDCYAFRVELATCAALLLFLGCGVAAAAPPDPPAAALGRADSLYEQHAFQEVLELADAELARARAAHGDSSLEVAEWLFRRCRVRAALTDFAGSRRDGEESIALRRALYGRGDRGQIRPLRELGWVALVEGRLAEAESLYACALAIDQAASPVDSLSLANTLFQQAKLFGAAGRYSRAVAEIRRALAIGMRQPGAEADQVAYWWNGLGTALREAGDDVLAEEAHRRALAGFEALFGPDDSFTGMACNDLANDLESLGDGAGAKQYYERALAIERRARGAQSAAAGVILHNLAYVASRMQEYDVALLHGTEALEIFDQALGPRSLDAARVLQVLGTTRAILGDPAPAEQDLRQAFAILTEKLGPDHPVTALGASNLARFLSAEGRPAEACSLLAAYAPRVERKLGPTHSYALTLRRNLARALLASGRPREAWPVAWQVCSAYGANLGAVFGAVSDRRALLYAERLRMPLDVLLSAAMADPGLGPGRRDSTFAMVALARGRVLDYLADRHRLASAPPGDSLAAAAAAARAELANLVLRGPAAMSPAEHAARLDEARWRKDEAESALARASRSFSRWLAVRRELETIDLVRITAALPPGATAVQYVRYRDCARVEPGLAFDPPVERDLAFVLRRGGRGEAAVHLVPLGAAARVDSLVRDYRREIERAGPDPAAMRAAARALHAAVWAPIEPLLGASPLVLLLPEGPLHFVDFATLVGPDDRFLVERQELHHLTSLRDLVGLAARDSLEPAPAARGEQRLLALADPDFDEAAAPLLAAATDERPDFRAVIAGCDPAALRAAALPGTAAELDRIGVLFERRGGWRVNELRRDMASEERFKREAAGSSLVHLATHGYFLGAACPNQAGGARAAAMDLPDFVRRESPLLLCGVLLSGSNHAGREARPRGSDDGWLTAEEIAGLDLSAADWVVLSACDTGLGETDPQEGVLGLQRAIELAGARTSILSLWKVPDATAPALMADLYARRLAGASTVDALRAAELASLERARADLLTDHPRFWAGLVASGDWR
jgi:CHAT domain-containing protein